MRSAGENFVYDGRIFVDDEAEASATFKHREVAGNSARQ
jgi:hypothetical protein